MCVCVCRVYDVCVSECEGFMMCVCVRVKGL